MIFIFSIYFTQTFASSWDIQHFKTADGKHMCSLASESNFKPCVLFWIKYQNDVVTFWQKPSLETWSWNYTVVKNTSWDMCVYNWLEVDVTNCKMLQSWTFSRDNLTQTWVDDNMLQTKTVEDNSWEIQKKLDNASELLNQVSTETSISSGSITTWEKINNSTSWDKSSLDSVSASWKELNSIWINSDSWELSGDVSDYWIENLNNISKNEWYMWLLAWAWIWGFIVIIILWILSIIFYLVNLIHAIANPIPNKALWIVGLIFFSILYIPYYFIVKRPFDKAKKLAKNNNISSQNIWVNNQSHTSQVKPQNTSWFPNQAVSQPTVKIGQSSPSVTPEVKKQEEKKVVEEFNFDLKL